VTDAELEPDPSPNYEQIREVLLRCVRKIAPARIGSDVDDIVQKAMVRLMKKLREDEGTSSFATSYLYRVANNAVIDELRKRGRRREVSDETNEDAASPDDPRKRALDVEVGNAIVDCLAKLNDDRRLAVSLYLEGHTVPEAAGMLAWPTKRAENFVYRGLKSMRKCLEHKGVTP